MATNPSGDGITWVLKFSGGTTEFVEGGSISDGDYYLNLAAGSVAAASSPTITNAASNQQNSFYRLFGDVNGNGLVQILAYNQFNLAYGSAFDFGRRLQRRLRLHASGFDTNQAYNQFKLRYGTFWSGL